MIEVLAFVITVFGLGIFCKMLLATQEIKITIRFADFQIKRLNPMLHNKDCCQACKGRGYLSGIVNNDLRSCSLCKGKGYLLLDQ